MKEIVSGLLCGVLTAFLFIVGCKVAEPIPPEIITVPATTLEKAMEVQLASATLLTDDPTRLLRVTNALTEEKPQFAFQMWSVRSIQVLTDTPVPSLLATHNDGSLTIFGLPGWDQVRDIAGGYDIWYRGEAVTCTIYTAKTGHVIRINSRKVSGQNEHDALVDHVMKIVPPMPTQALGEIPNVMHDLRMDGGIVRGPLYGNVASNWDRFATVMGRAER